MNLAFSSGADFGRMSDVRLAISEVRHKAYINVHNKGLEAAAATAVGMTRTSMPLPTTPIVSHFTVCLFSRDETCIYWQCRL